MVTRANRLIEPDLDRVLAFCAEDPIERVYLEEVARRGPGRLVATVEAMLWDPGAARWLGGRT